MIPTERIEKIESSRPCSECWRKVVYDDDAKWLINRVKRLTEALEQYCTCDPSSIFIEKRKCLAHKVLEGEE